LFLAGACMMVGILFLSLASDAGWIFSLAAGAALTALGLLIARSDNGPDLRRQRLPLAAKHD